MACHAACHADKSRKGHMLDLSKTPSARVHSRTRRTPCRERWTSNMARGMAANAWRTFGIWRDLAEYRG
eukprot:1158098-Pelagomonas_calceolata.AAC.5